MFFYIVLNTFLIMLSTATLLYISLATGLGPWIAPILAVLVGGMMRDTRRALLLTISASLGGAVATGIGFSITTIFFLDPALWQQWMESPVSFCGVLCGAVLVAGGWGLYAARHTRENLISQNPSFPVPQVVCEAVHSSRTGIHVRLLSMGAALAAGVDGIRDIYGGSGSVYIAPLGWAAGFLAGPGVIIPLLLGMTSKYLVVQPLVAWGKYSQWLAVPERDALYAVCSGLLVSGLLAGAWQQRASVAGRIGDWARWSHYLHVLETNRMMLGGMGLSVCGLCVVGGMPVYGALLAVVVIALLIESLLQFAAKTGLAPYGRYMTLAMLPVMCVPGVTLVQAALVCVMVGIVGSVAVDGMHAVVIGQREFLDGKSILRAQLIGLGIAASIVGVLLWFFCSHFSLGVAPLIAHRGLSRALIMQTFQYQSVFVCIGLLLGAFFYAGGISPALVCGGLIMPSTLVCALAVGAGMRLVQGAGTGTIFWSGVLMGDVLWNVAQGFWLYVISRF
jgi:hypothetical protein